MTDSITLDDVKKIASLARLNVTEEEVIKFQSQLTPIMEYFNELAQTNVENVNITAQVTGLENITRVKDEIGDRTLNSTSAVSQAPHVHKNYIQVPALIDENNSD